MSAYLIRICVLAGVTSLYAAEANLTVVSTTNNIDNNTLNIENKSLHFVDVIKNNLRKNNDDYIALDTPGAKLGFAGKTRRRANDSEETISQDENIETTTPSTETETPVFRSFSFNQALGVKQGQGSHLLVSRSAPDTNIEEVSMLSSNASVNDEERQARVETWKRLIERNKRLRMYTSTTQIEPSSAATFPSSKAIVRSRPHKLGHNRNHIPHMPQAARARPLHGNLPLRTPAAGRAPPNADQLDMAPARGAYIHDLRVKGLFCHRNVLWPEGPKYDSHGNTLMPAFDAKRIFHKSRSFVETTTALFILPRCCNCCKKSVLGCQ